MEEAGAVLCFVVDSFPVLASSEMHLPSAIAALTHF
jgi:hypothetical protein